ncbi:MAG: hypothetical protein ACK4R6_00845 [Spirosomataceae bacterium]
MKKLYLFTFLFLQTTFATQAQFNLADLKDAAIDAAIIRKNKAEAAGFTAEAQTLATEIIALEATALTPPIIPDKAIGFNPVPIDIATNPHVAALYVWAEDYLTQPEPNYAKSTLTAQVFPAGGHEETRELGRVVERLIWLTLSPQSRYQFHPLLFKKLLLIVYATSDDYLLFGTGGGPDVTPLDDWFAAPGAAYSWKIVVSSFGQFLPPFLKKRIEDASDKMGQLFYERSLREMVSSTSYPSGYATYCNRDISFAEILVHSGQFRNNQTWLDRGNLIIGLVLSPFVLYPDGAYAYIGNQNEVASYHGATTNSLAKLFAVTNQNNILTGIANAKNYELINIEESFVNEFYHVPVWKTQWNGFSGASGINLLYISNSPHLKTFYERNDIEFGKSYEPIDLSFFHSQIIPSPIPNNYLVYDRNIQGVKRRINDFSYGITTRKVSLPSNLGAITLAGAMTTTFGTNSKKELDAALMSVHAKVHTIVGNDTEWDKWVYMMGDMNPKVNMSKLIGAASTPSTLYRQTAGPAGSISNWDSFQQWLTLPDRMIGLVEVFPKNNSAQNAYQIDGRIKLGYGRTGNLFPKDIEVITPGSEYNYGNLKVLIHQHDFTTVDTAAAGVVRDSPLQATEIRLRYDLSNNGTTLISYPGTTRKFFIAEIRYKNATGNITVERYNATNVKGLIVTSGNNKYAVFRNLGTTSATINVSNYLTAGNTNRVHYSRTDNAEIAPTTFTGSSLTIPANEQRLLISSNISLDNEQSWENFNVLLDQLPGLNIESNSVTNGVCNGETLSFSSITDNLGTNTTYQWTINDVSVSGATNPTFSSTALLNGQKVNCLMTTTLPNGSNFSLKSNDIIVAVSTKPSTPVVTSLSPSIFVGNTIILTASSTGTINYNWSGPNNFKSSLQNPTVTFATLNESGVYTVIAENNGCYSIPASVTISTTGTHIWRGTVDSNYGNDANWDFGYPKFNIGAVEIDLATRYPIINPSSSFSAPSLVVKKDAPFEITGFYSVGDINSYVSKSSFTFNNVQSSTLTGNTLTGTYEIVGAAPNQNVDFKWYRSDNIYGNNAVLIGTSLNYTLTTEDADKFIAFSVRKLNTFGGVESIKTSEFRKIAKVNIIDNQLVGASSIFSLRQTKKTYTGALIRVRRDRDNSEIDVFYDESGYLDTDALLRFANYGNVFVTVWYDQSGNLLNAIQTNKDKQPFIVKNGRLTRNNFLPAIEFIGTDILEVPTATQFDAPTGFALFITCKQLSDHPSTEFRTSIAYRSQTGTNGNGASLIGTYGFRNILSTTNSRQVIGFMRNSSNGILSNGTVSVSNYRDFSNQSIQLTNYCNGIGTNNNVISVNNNQFSLTETLTLATTPINGAFSIGNRNTSQNNTHFIIGEVILYNQPISAPQRDEIEKNMMKLN